MRSNSAEGRGARTVGIGSTPSGSSGAGLADSSRKKPSAREKVPYAGYHDCWGNGKNIGAAVFCGFVMVDENKKEGNDNV